MKTVKNAVKKNKHINVNSRMQKGAQARSEIYLNVAFDRLNRSKTSLNSISSEVGDIMTEALQCGIDVYQQAIVFYNAGKYSPSAKHARAVVRFCTLLGNIADENSENALKLSVPPKMRLEISQKVKAKVAYHPALQLLHSLIRKKMTRASKFYKSRMNGYSEIIQDVSALLSKSENYH
ncbi:MAG: hypothetical protein K0R29_2365 [Pseudobdellovibrio sp.]|nr:hypothetical protein [Pseudobdellovibrio sp.]